MPERAPHQPGFRVPPAFDFGTPLPVCGHPGPQTRDDEADIEVVEVVEAGIGGKAIANAPQQIDDLRCIVVFPIPS